MWHPNFRSGIFRSQSQRSLTRFETEKVQNHGHMQKGLETKKPASEKFRELEKRIKILEMSS